MTVPRVLVVAGEASGDAHAAPVLEALSGLLGDVDARGMGGERLSNAGLRLEVDLRRTTAMGVAELLWRLPQQMLAFTRMLHLVEVWRPHAALLVDVPDFNLPLGARLRALGVRVLGYVAPQFWAWRVGRLRSIGASFDRLACILPFEVPPLRKHGVDAVFVGHPAAEGILWRSEPSTLLNDEQPTPRKTQGAVSQSSFRNESCRHGIGWSQRCVALLPGSRIGEVRRLLDPMIRAAGRLRRRDPSLRVLLPMASSLMDEKLFSSVPDWIQLLSSQDAPHHGRAALARADVAAVASGTATLEAALLETPLVATYKLAPLSYGVAKLLVRSRFVALPNIVVNAPIVPELIQSNMNVDSLTAHLSELLEDEGAANSQRRALRPLRAMLRGPGATKTTTRLLAEMLQ